MVRTDTLLLVCVAIGVSAACTMQAEDVGSSDQAQNASLRLELVPTGYLRNTDKISMAARLHSDHWVERATEGSITLKLPGDHARQVSFDQKCRLEQWDSDRTRACFTFEVPRGVALNAMLTRQDLFYGPDLGTEDTGLSVVNGDCKYHMSFYHSYDVYAHDPDNSVIYFGPERLGSWYKNQVEMGFQGSSGNLVGFGTARSITIEVPSQQPLTFQRAEDDKGWIPVWVEKVPYYTVGMDHNLNVGVLGRWGDALEAPVTVRVPNAVATVGGKVNFSANASRCRPLDD
jgi:hypothetical protein